MHGVFCQTIMKSCQITNNMLKIISTKYCRNSATFFPLNDLLYHWTQYQLCYLNVRYLGKKEGGPGPPRNKSGGPRVMRPHRFRHLWHYFIPLPANSGGSVGYYLSRNIINSTFLNIADKQNALQYHYRS